MYIVKRTEVSETINETTIDISADEIKALGVSIKDLLLESSDSEDGHKKDKVNIFVSSNGEQLDYTGITQKDVDGTVNYCLVLSDVKDAVAKEMLKANTGLKRSFEARYGTNQQNVQDRR